MEKEKIRSIRNLEDSNWYVLFATDKTLDYLDNIFEIYDQIEDFELNQGETKIKSLTREGTFPLFLNEDQTFVYIIISNNSVNLIVRKNGDYKKFTDAINNYFKFIKN